MRTGLMIAAVVAMVAVAIPLLGGFFGDDSNEATRLVQATQTTEDKAQAVTRSYNDVIPPAPAVQRQIPLNQPPQGALPIGNPRAQPDGGHVQEVVDPKTGRITQITTNPEGTPIAEPGPQLTPGEHAVADAMAFLNQVQTEFNPGSTEYIRAVELLKGAWAPRYARATEEFKRFEDRVQHAESMGYEYLELQQRLTQSIQSHERRYTHEERDILEQELVLDWVNQANGVLSQARAIKADLDDMNLEITKLELSATFAAVYEGFLRMPIAITLLNTELARFQIETERIYANFGPQAD